MSSSEKFPSGLNNWVGSDMPARLDFVGDNEILDQNTMWKNTYDNAGDVAESGGIAGFAMAKSQYDADGTVAGTGGIAQAIRDAVSVIEGLTPYTHSKTGTVHTLTGAGGSNIKFNATAGYNEYDTFMVDGVACSGQTSDGQPLLGGCFSAGAVVVCYRGGNALNFKTGGTGLHSRLAVCAARPKFAHLNTLWIQSSIPLNRYVISPVRPPFLNQTGDVHIKTGNSNTRFQAPGNQALIIEPQEATQRNSAGEWIKCPLEHFNGTKWTAVTDTLWLLDGTELYKNVTGGWNSYLGGGYWYDYYGTGMGSTPNPFEFFPTGHYMNNIADKITAQPIDLAGIRFLSLDYTGHPKYGDGSIGTPQNFLYITSINGGNHRDHAITFTKTNNIGRSTMVLDVSNYNGKYYIGTGMTQSNYTTNGIQIWRIWGTY